MFRLTWKLFAFFSLILPILAATIPVCKEVEDLEKRDAHMGGRGTWYTPGLGSCGETNNGGQLVVALSKDIMNKDVDCGKTVRITSNGKTIDAKIVDTCPGCGPNDLDMSPTLFESFASLGTGVINIDWDELM